MFQNKFVDESKHILFSITFFSENGAFCKIICKNLVQPGRL
jgi:hypothetical protein